ncbi:MAG: histidine phosphatase family protein [Geminicoccaceae bacterium]
MPELLLFRHAKSRWDEPEVGDHDRDLAPRGLEAARRMGALLRERGLIPDRVLCSTARRAVHTWELAAQELGAAAPVRLDDRLYMAAPERIVTVARELGGDARRLLVVGHDPGMHRLAIRLVGKGDAGLRDRLAAKFPTAGLACYRLGLARWAEFSGAPGELVGFWRPRDLDAAD